jgi:hypothetical protein
MSIYEASVCAERRLKVQAAQAQAKDNAGQGVRKSASEGGGQGRMSLLDVSSLSSLPSRGLRAPGEGQTRFGNGQRACDVAIYFGAPGPSEYEDGGR